MPTIGCVCARRRWGALARALRAAVAGREAELQSLAQEHGLDPAVLAGLVEDLGGHVGQALVVAGPHLPASVHAAVALLNDDLGAGGPHAGMGPQPPLRCLSAIRRTSRRSSRRAWDVLICLSVNPVYDWPGGAFEALMAKATLSVGHAMHPDETQAALRVVAGEQTTVSNLGMTPRRATERGSCPSR